MKNFGKSKFFLSIGAAVKDIEWGKLRKCIWIETFTFIATSGPSILSNKKQNTDIGYF